MIVKAASPECVINRNATKIAKVSLSEIADLAHDIAGEDFNTFSEILTKWFKTNPQVTVSL